jgi:hypothetical protein
LYDKIIKTTPVKGTPVCLVVEGIAPVKPLVIDIETVGVLHRELAHPEQSGLWTRLISELDLNLVPDLRQIPIGADLVASNGRKDFFMGHSEAEIPPCSILNTKHVIAHRVPSARLLPNLSRVECRKVEFLSTYAVHFFSDDLFYLEK